MIEDVAGNYWTTRRFEGRIQVLGWDADDESLVDDWLDATPEDICNFCRFLDSP